jgi:hypothetical protein
MAQKAGRQRIQRLLAALPPLQDLLRGSLLERQTFHPASTACATCASGKGHHQWVLNVNYPGGKTRQTTLHPDQVSQARQQLANLAQVRETLEQICEFNRQHLRSERDQRRKAEHD